MEMFSSAYYEYCQLPYFLTSTWGGKQMHSFDIQGSCPKSLWPALADHLHCFVHFASSTGVNIFLLKNLILYRHKESAQSKNASSSTQRAQSDRSGNEHVRGSEQQSSVLSNSGSPDRRQTQPTDVLPSVSGQTKNASLTA